MAGTTLLSTLAQLRTEINAVLVPRLAACRQPGGVWTVPVGRRVGAIRISGNPFVAVCGLRLSPEPTGSRLTATVSKLSKFSQDPEAALQGRLTRTQWSKEGGWITLRFDTPTHVDSLEVRNTQEHDDTRWILGATVAVSIDPDGSDWQSVASMDEEYAQWEARLRDAPCTEPERPLREALHVLLDGAFLRNGEACARRLASLKGAAVDSPISTAIAELRRDFTAAIAPLQLTFHGFRIPLAQRDRVAVAAGLARIIGAIEALGYACFANSGTLLGLVREGALIGHDDDIDLAVLISGATLTEVIDGMIRFESVLAKRKLLTQSFRGARTHVKTGVAGGASVDVFPAWVENGRLFVWPYCNGKLAAADHLPLASLTLEGHRVPIPRNPEALLAWNYGEHWRIPDPDFRFDWDAARTRFAPFRTAFKNAGDRFLPKR